MTNSDINGVEELPWLDEVYICKILNSFEDAPVKLLYTKKDLATSKGENFVSAVHRITARYCIEGQNNEKCISFIVKSRRDSEFIDEIQQEFNIFEREGQLYKFIKPSCEKILKTIGDDIRFGPRALYVDGKMIVLEDLKTTGYHISDVKNGLTYEQVKFVIEKVAKFHAATAVLHEKNPDLFHHHHNGNLGEKETPLHDFYRFSFSTCLELIKGKPEFDHYVKKLENFKPDLIQRAINIFTRSENGFHTLNHGDLWVNNLMFRHENQHIADVLLVDFQEGFFGSPGIDLNYLIYSSLQGEVYEKRYKFIEMYQHILAATLKQLNYNKRIPTLQDILDEFHSKGDHGIFTATSFFPILINEHTEYSDPENFLTDDDEARRKRMVVYNNPKYILYLKRVLSDFVAAGVL